MMAFIKVEIVLAYL